MASQELCFAIKRTQFYSTNLPGTVLGIEATMVNKPRSFFGEAWFWEHKQTINTCPQCTERGLVRGMRQGKEMHGGPGVVDRASQNCQLLNWVLNDERQNWCYVVGREHSRLRDRKCKGRKELGIIKQLYRGSCDPANGVGEWQETGWEREAKARPCRAWKLRSRNLNLVLSPWESLKVWSSECEKGPSSLL